MRRLTPFLHRLERREKLWLSDNDIHDSAMTIAEALLRFPGLQIQPVVGGSGGAWVESRPDLE